MQTSVISIIGWAATFLYIIAYLLLSLKCISANRHLYHILNFFGAAGLIINAIALKDNPNIIVNLAWLLIALFSILDISKRKNKTV